jgi:hypothetical protein
MGATDDTTPKTLLAALARVQRLLLLRASELEDDPEFSEVTQEFSIDGPTPGCEAMAAAGRSGQRGEIVLSGYVDVTPRGHLGAAWLYYVCDLGSSGWRVSRRIIVYQLQGKDIIANMPDRHFENWHDIAQALPGLIEELLATPLPEVGEPVAAQGA